MSTKDALVQLLKENKQAIGKYALYGGIGAIAAMHLPAVMLGASLGIGFWTSRKLTDKIDEKVALNKIERMDKELDKMY